MPSYSANRSLISSKERCMPYHYGKYRAVVSDISDDTGMGRIKAKVPSFGGVETVWALPCGQASSGFEVPTVGQVVWIEYEGGDVNHPIWSFGPRRRSDISGEMTMREPTDSPKRKVIGSAGQYSIIFDDMKGQEAFIVRDEQGNYIRINADSVSSIIINAVSKLIEQSNGKDVTVSGTYNEEVQANKDVAVGKDYREAVVGDKEIVVVGKYHNLAGKYKFCYTPVTGSMSEPGVGNFEVKCALPGLTDSMNPSLIKSTPTDVTIGALFGKISSNATGMELGGRPMKKEPATVDDPVNVVLTPMGPQLISNPSMYNRKFITL